MKNILKDLPVMNTLNNLIYQIYKIGYFTSFLTRLILKLLFKPFRYFLRSVFFLLKSIGYIFYFIAKSIVRIVKRIGKSFLGFLLMIKRSMNLFPSRISNGFSAFPRVGKIKYFFSILFITNAMILVLAFFSFLNSVPNPKSLSYFSASSSSQIFDKNNTLLFNSYHNDDRIPVSLSNVSPILIKATISSEDSRFYKHFGIDLIAIIRSIVNNLTHKSVQGGSTITQQLAKNVFLTDEKSFKRKIEEAVLAIRIEHNFNKEQILELYLNAVSYGGDTVGIEAASERYFGKKAKDLSSKEAVYLASITSGPSIYGPTSVGNNSYKLKENIILQKMVTNKDITPVQSNEISHEKLVFSNQTTYKRAPHAVDYTLSELPKYIANAEDISKGFLIQTTIDLPLQNYIQQHVLTYIAKETGNNINNAGVIVVDPKSGSILAMIGSANYFEGNSGQYNTVIAKRQMGSAVKIITYALALDTLYTPASTLSDSQTSFKEFPGYKPRNYDGKFHGKVSLKNAFANSYNIPALKLAYDLGLRNVADKGVAMGIPEFEFKDNNIPLSFAIGGVELPLQHLTSAYSVVANNGKSVNLHIIKSITDYDNKIIYKTKSESHQQIISPNTAKSIFNILSDTNAKLPAFGHSADFDFGANQVAIKTGTSNDNKDNVAMAFTQDFVVGVWVGNNNGESMDNIASGYVGATNIMHTVVTKVLDNIAKEKANNSLYALENERKGGEK